MMAEDFIDIQPHVILGDFGKYPSDPLIGKHLDWPKDRPVDIAALFAEHEEAGSHCGSDRIACGSTQPASDAPEKDPLDAALEQTARLLESDRRNICAGKAELLYPSLTYAMSVAA